jgi:cell division protein FtsX
VLHLRSWAHRRGQSTVVLLLAALVVVSCVVGPLYERAIEQGAVRATLTSADRISRGVSLTLNQDHPATAVAPTGPAARLFASPVAGVEVPVGFRGATFWRVTQLVGRDGLCDHLVLASGSCPSGTSAGVLVSEAVARAEHLAVGQPLALWTPGADTPPSPTAGTEVDVRIAGIYRPYRADDDYWFGRQYVTDGAAPALGGADAVLGGAGFVRATAGTLLDGPTRRRPNFAVDLPLRADAVGVDDLALLSATLTALPAGQRESKIASATTQLDSLIEQIDHSRDQAHAIVLAVGVQLALLALIAFGVVAAGAADQRRPELALARLRGRGRARTALGFALDVGGLALLGLVPGVALAWLLTWLGCRIWLPAGISPHWAPLAVGAAAASVLLVLLLVAIVGARAARLPVGELLRTVPARPRKGFVLGIGEAVVAAATAGALYLTLRGDGSSGVSTLAPSLLAILVGLMLGRALVAGAALAGTRLFWRGRIGAGSAALGLARRPGARLAVTVICAATALAVFSVQQFSVGSANREQRAGVVPGAAVTLAVGRPASAAALADAVHAADPSGTYATPVMAIYPVGLGGRPMVAVDPATFATVSNWGRDGLRPAANLMAHLNPPAAPPPMIVSGDRVSVSVDAESWRVLAGSDGQDGGGPAPTVHPTLDLHLTSTAGATQVVSLGPLHEKGGAGTFAADLPKVCDRCRLTQIGLGADPEDYAAAQVSVTITQVAFGTGQNLVPVDLGPAADWQSITPITFVPQTGHDATGDLHDTAAGLRLDATDLGGVVLLQHLDQPVARPVLMAGPTPDAIDEIGAHTTNSLDGLATRVTVAGTLPFVPKYGGTAFLVDIRHAAATPDLDATVTSQVWLSRDDPAAEAALAAALRKDGIPVASRATATSLRHTYEHSAAGWSGQATLAVAVLAVLLALALVLLGVASTRRVRQDDLAALGLVGARARTLRWSVLLELLTVVTTGLVGGGFCGLVGAHLALPHVPLFAGPSPVPLQEEFPTDWAWAAVALLGTAAVLVLLVVGAARSLVRGAAGQGGGER